MNFVKPIYFSLKNHPTLNEKWVQSIIADDPTILGLGDVELRDQERLQDSGGRLDLLLDERETNQRYEVELQLGTLDESHIIRTIEYWDIERKRFPNYKHTAVIIAEEITGRFLNVVSLFNGHIPLIAIQMKAIQVGEIYTLVFSKVMDEISRGLDEDGDDIIQTDRPYWEKKSSVDMLKCVDSLFTLIQEVSPETSLNYNKHYIGLKRHGSGFNFVTFTPKKKRVNLEIKLPKSEETDALIDDAGFATLTYDSNWQLYRLSLSAQDIKTKRVELEQLFCDAFARREA